MNILKIHSSARINNSISRQLSNQLATKLLALHDVDNTTNGDAGTIIERDLTTNLSFVTDEMIAHFYTPEEALTAEQRTLLANSDALTHELMDSDIIILGAPMYNFSVSGALKTYIDQICRLGKTFATNDAGFEGLLTDKILYLIAVSGGTPMGSKGDFLTPYLRHALAFIGITDVREIVIDQFDANARQTAISHAEKQIESLQQDAIKTSD